MATNQIPSQIVAIVGNYNFSHAADQLKKFFSQHFPTWLVDNSSLQTPEDADRILENRFYPSLWEEAVNIGCEQESEWILFCASDVRIETPGALIRGIREATEIPSIGIYTPSLNRKSRAAFRQCIRQATAGLRRTELVEGFFFLCRRRILEKVYPCPPTNLYGHGLDIDMCYESKQAGYASVVDDRALIYHPPSREEDAIDNRKAHKMRQESQREEVRIWFQGVKTKKASQSESFFKQVSLDLGSGPRPRNPFRAETCWGIDLQTEIPGRVIQADLVANPIPVGDDSVDYVTAFDFIEHVPRFLYRDGSVFPFVALMNEIYRILRWNGLFLALTPAYPEAIAFRDPTHVNIITDETFPLYFCQPKTLARMYGFRGSFLMEHQSWKEGKLLTILRVQK